MPLVRQSVEFRLTEGLDEKSGKKATLKLLRSVNVRQDKTGELSQRYGTNCIGYVNTYRSDDDSSPTICTPELLTKRGNELVRVGREQLATYSLAPSPISADYKWRDFKPEALVYRTPLSAGGAYSLNVDSAHYEGYICTVSYAYQASGGSYEYVILATVTDASGTPVWTDYEVAAPSTSLGPARVIATDGGNTGFIVVWGDGAAIKARTLEVPSLSWGSAVTVVAATASGAAWGGAAFDVCGTSTEGDGLWFLAYEGTGGSAGVRVVGMDATSSFDVIVTDTQVSADTAIRCIAVHAAEGGHVYVAWTHEPSRYYVKVRGHYQANLAAVFAAQEVSNTASFLASVLGIGSKNANSSLLSFFYQDDSAAAPTKSQRGTVSATVSSAGTVALLPQALMWAVPVSKPFYHSDTGRYYLFVTLATVAGTVNASDYEPSTLYLVDIGDAESSVYPYFRIVATSACRTSAWFWWNILIPGSGPARVSPLGGGRWTTAAAVYSGTGSGLLNDRTATTLFDIRLANTKPVAAEIDGKLILAGGTPSIYDGDSVAEMGFAHEPSAEYMSAASTSGSGALTVGGKYRYLATYEWFLADGSIMRSVVSNPAAPASNTTGDDTMTVSVPRLALTNKQAAGSDSRAPRIQLYRTLANAATYYMVPYNADVFNQAVGSETFGTFRNAITDTTSDTVLRERPVLYTTGNPPLPPDEIPPSSSYVAVIGRRVWLGGTDDDSIWYSDKVYPGEAPKFSSSRVLDPFAGGRVTAIGYLGDQEIIIFKQDSVWAIRGDGPNSAGTDGDFTEPERVSADVGCIEPRSVLSTTEGIYFLSRAGICALTRGFKVEYIGKAVEDTLGSATITSACLVPDLNEVRFTIENSTSVLVYDQYHGAWRVNDYPQAGNIVSSTYWNGRWTFIDANGRTWQETYDANHDTANGVSTYANASFQTSHVKLQGGVQGWQRTWDAYLIGERHTSHGLTIEVYDDYGTTAGQTKAWTSAEVDSWTSLRARVHIKNQKAQAISLKVSSTPTTGTLGNGRGFTLQGIRFDIATDGKSPKNIPSTRTS